MFFRRKVFLFLRILENLGVGNKLFSGDVNFINLLLSPRRKSVISRNTQVKYKYPISYHNHHHRLGIWKSAEGLSVGINNSINYIPKFRFSSSATSTPRVSTTYSIVLQQRIASLPKGTLRKMELDSKLMEKVLSPEVKALVSIFEKYNYEIRLAGGPVRDLLMEKIPDDLDFATTATPDEMKAMFEKEGIRMINAKGEAHGTITARINDKENFEVTTLRIDVVTDGRRAEVAFTTDWEIDAARRDLTVNSMFLDMKGVIYDYFNGAEDLKIRKIRFVGNPEQRIQEDYLRILRYFRFYGRLSTKSDVHEEPTLLSIKKNLDGLQRISGERIWMELKKILTGNYSKELLVTMVELGMGKYIGLPEELNDEEFKKVCERADKLKLTLHPITKLAALMHIEKDGVDLNARLRLSAFERDMCLFILLHRNTAQSENSIKPFQRLTVFTKSKVTDVRQWSEEVMKYAGAVSLLESFQKWELPKFPISGSVLIENKVPAGRAMTKVLNELKEIWIDSDFTVSSDELAAHLPQILEEVQKTQTTPPKKSKKAK